MLEFTDREKRAQYTGLYIAVTGNTVRQAAKKLGMSKSTVFRDVRVILPRIDAALYVQVDEVLNWNKRMRHIRGGRATKELYKNRARGVE